MKTVEAYLFQTDQGDRFFFPSYVYDETKEDGRSKSSIILDSMMFDVSLGLSFSKDEDRWLKLEVKNGIINVKHVQMELLHPALMHGAATVVLISGPSFDKYMEDEHE